MEIHLILLVWIYSLFRHTSISSGLWNTWIIIKWRQHHLDNKFLLFSYSFKSRQTVNVTAWLNTIRTTVIKLIFHTLHTRVSESPLVCGKIDCHRLKCYYMRLFKIRSNVLQAFRKWGCIMKFVMILVCFRKTCILIT